MVGVLGLVGAVVAVTVLVTVWLMRLYVGRSAPQRPGAAVTVTVVLAGLGVVATVLGWLDAVSALDHGYSAGFGELSFVRPRGWLRGYYWSTAVADPGVVVVLTGGAVLHVARRRYAQVVLTVGCAVVIALGIYGAVVRPDLVGSGPAGAVDRVAHLVPLGFPITVIVLAWLPSARRWYRSRLSGA